MAIVFDFASMLQGVQNQVNVVEGYLNDMKAATAGGVQIGAMFNLQFHMQIMSQFMEACSNSLSAVHNEMMTMARATKGT